MQSPTCAPRRAAAKAASQPACPAPITITSNESATVPLFICRCRSARKYAREGHPAPGARRSLRSAARASCRSASTNSSGASPPASTTASRARATPRRARVDERHMTHVRDRRQDRAADRRRAPDDSAASQSSRPAPVAADTRPPSGRAAAAEVDLFHDHMRRRLLSHDRISAPVAALNRRSRTARGRPCLLPSAPAPHLRPRSRRDVRRCPRYRPASRADRRCRPFPSPDRASCPARR